MKRWGEIAAGWAGENVRPWMVLAALGLGAWFMLHSPLPWLKAQLENPNPGLVLLFAAAVGLPVYLQYDAKHDDDDDRS